MTCIRMIATGCIITFMAASWGSIAAAQQKTRQPARAQANATLEQAWHQCLQWIDQTAPRTGENDMQRTAQFKACMTQYGFTR